MHISNLESDQLSLKYVAVKGIRTKVNIIFKNPLQAKRYVVKTNYESSAVVGDHKKDLQALTKNKNNQLI